MNHNELDNGKWWFFFVCLYLIIDLGRPQDVLPIGWLRPGMVCFICLAILLVIKGSLGFESKQLRLIWCFFFLLCLYIPFARNNYYALITAKDYLLFLPFIVSITLCVSSVYRVKVFINLLVVLMVYMAIYSLSHSGIGSGGYFMDENDLSLYINIVLPICYFMLLFVEEFKHKVFYLFAIIVGLAAEINSLSRGGFVGLLAVSIFIWFVSQKKLSTLIFIALSSLLVFYFVDALYWQEMSTITDTAAGTGYARLMSWKAAWMMFLDYPLGVGGNNFQVLFEDYQGEAFTRGMWGRAAHSIWFTLLPELGVIGVIIYTKLICVNFKDLWLLKSMAAGDNHDLKYIQMLSMALMASMVGYFSSGSFLSVLYYPYFWYVTGLIVVLKRLAVEQDGLCLIHDQEV